MSPVLCVDVGSTFTKAVLVDADSGELLAAADHPTTRPEVLAGVAAVQQQLHAGSAEVLLCSSAGGGLRLAVVGYERAVTAEAGRRVALSAGGRVVHLTSGLLTAAQVRELAAARPDVVLLTGGTDGGDADVVVHNARRLGIARLPVPVVLAANADAAEAAAAELSRRGRRVSVTANVLPRIGELDPLPARRAIRAAFLAHVIGGKGLSRPSSKLAGRTFAQLVRAATPDAVLEGAALLATVPTVPTVPTRPGVPGLLLIDVGGATTDVYSLLPDPSASTTRPVVPEPQARTVEGDLGVRAGARGLLAAAVGEGLLAGSALAALEASVGSSTTMVDVGTDRALAALAVLIAARRHGRPERPGAAPRPLRDVGLVIGSGGVLRHADPAGRREVLAPLLADHGGGWAVPDRAALAVDGHAALFAAGLLAATRPAAAAALARAAAQPVL